MSAMWLVAARELREKGRDRAFIIGSIITLAIVLAFAIIPGLVGNDPDRFKVGVVGPQAQAVADVASRAAPAVNARIDVTPYATRAQAEAAITDNSVRVAVVGDELIVRDDPRGTAVELLQAASGRLRAEQVLRAAGTNQAAAARVLDQEPLPVRAIDPRAKERSTREGLAFVGLIILFISVLTLAVMVAFGVVEEKSSRVVEVLLAAVRPRDLLGGKVIGLGLLGLIQLVAIAVPALVAAIAFGTLDLPAGSSPGILGVLLLWFVLGYVIYAALFAAAGSLVTRQEDLQSVITPISLLAQGSAALGFVAVANPSGLIAKILSFVPPVAPFAVPTRFAGLDWSR
jgi:ABC-2 type transport system permease protein